MRLPKLLLVVLLTILTPAACAQTLNEINRLAGLDQTLDSIKGALASGIDQMPGEITDDFAEAWEAAASDAFSGPRILAAIEARMEGKLTQIQLAKLHAFYSSELGKDVTRMETAAIGKDTEIADLGGSIYPELAQKDPERLALYNRLIEGLDLYSSGEAMSLNVAFAVLSGIFAMAGDPISNNEIMEMINEERDDMREEIKEQINFATAYTYRDMPIDTLSAYVAFLETGEGTAYYDNMITALSDVLAGEARQFGHALQTRLAEKKI